MASRSTVGNRDIIPYALYLLGGSGRYIDVEEIFVRCYEIAPQRFSWRTHPLPNYKTASKALRDFEARFPNALMKTQDGLGRQLSTEGIEWVRGRLSNLEHVFGLPLGGMSRRRPSQRLLGEFAANPIVEKHLRGIRVEVTRYQAAEILLCAPDSPPEVWRERLETYRSASEAVGRSDLKGFLAALEDAHPDWFGGAMK